MHIVENFNPNYVPWLKSPAEVPITHMASNNNNIINNHLENENLCSQVNYI